MYGTLTDVLMLHAENVVLDAPLMLTKAVMSSPGAKKMTSLHSSLNSAVVPAALSGTYCWVYDVAPDPAAVSVAPTTAYSSDVAP